MSEDQLQPQDTLDDRGVDDILDEGISPPERPRGVTAKGVTDAEQLEGETIDERVAQEEPEVWEDARPSATRTSSTVTSAARSATSAPAGSRPATRRTDLYAEDEGIDGAGASAEEAAVHTIDEPS